MKQYSLSEHLIIQKDNLLLSIDCYCVFERAEPSNQSNQSLISMWALKEYQLIFLKNRIQLNFHTIVLNEPVLTTHLHL